MQSGGSCKRFHFILSRTQILQQSEFTPCYYQLVTFCASAAFHATSREFPERFDNTITTPVYITIPVERDRKNMYEFPCEDCPRKTFFFAPPVSLELHPAVEFSRLNPLAKSLCFSLRVRGTVYPADPLALGHSAVLQYYDLVSAFSAASAGSGPRGALDPEYSSRGIVVGSIAVPPAVPQRPSASGKAARRRSWPTNTGRGALLSRGWAIERGPSALSLIRLS